LSARTETLRELSVAEIFRLRPIGRKLDRSALASLAGSASGSAARSLYGGFAELRNTGGDISVSSLLSPEEWPLRVVVAITATGPKAVGSTEAMEISRKTSPFAMEISRKTSPFYGRWVEQQDQDLEDARAAIAARDFAKLASVAEHNCLKMHSVMWGSRPPIVYWNSATLACMQAIRDLQAQGVAVFFTIDAGPQLKAVCEPAFEAQVREALAATEGVHDTLTTGLGQGASQVPDD
jgi:diphosphomevalonate decarboxylase